MSPSLSGKRANNGILSISYSFLLEDFIILGLMQHGVLMLVAC